MTNAVAKIEDYSALDAAIGTSMEGEPLRFREGVFIRGFDKTEVKFGTRLIMHSASLSDGFIKWEDGKPVEWRIRELRCSATPSETRTRANGLTAKIRGPSPW
jgi:hypothetical protein